MKTYLGIGSNLGDKKKNIDCAIRQLSAEVGSVIRQSSYYISEAWGFQSEHDFVNIVVLIETTLDPLDLLHRIQKIEREMGRTQKSEHGIYSDRIINIDILLYDDLQLDLPQLKIPHPLMKERDFVMKPLQEILGLD